MREEEAISALKSHLQVAEEWNWDIHKMLFCDGFLNALNLMTDKKFGFSGTDVFITDDSGMRTDV